MLQIGHLDLLKVESDFAKSEVYPTHAGSMGCFMLMVWLHKFKVGHYDLIIMTLHSPEKPENLNIPMCHIHKYTLMMNRQHVFK